MADNKEKLFDQFPATTYDEWRAKVEADLKGADFDKKLVWRTNEGFNVQPVYRREDIKDLQTTNSLPGEYPYVRGTRTDNDWLTRQEIVAESAEEANSIALDVLNKGVTSLGFSVKEATADEVATLLKDIHVPAVEVNFTCCPNKAQALAEVLVKFLQEKGWADDFRGSIDYNPLRKALRHGAGNVSDDVVAQAKKLVETVAPVKGLRVLSVDSNVLSNAGAYIFQELGYALAWGADWMTLLTDAGLDATEVARRIKFNMGVSSNFFMEIAKFRAARMLWAEIVRQYNPSCPCAEKMMCHAVTSRFNQTIYDAYVNLLRSQTEAFSAAVAGVDSMTVTPFDVAYKKPDEFSERIARNQQFLLKEESHMDKVIDPAGGSYYVETLTVSIAQQAWKLFLDVEENGSFFKQVNEGLVQKAVNASCEKRHTDVARRKEILLGTNQYPNINEIAHDKIESTACGCGCGCDHEDNGGLLMKRAATDFEALRLQTEAWPVRPKVFMLTIGNLAMRQARAQFSCNFLAAAGYKVIDNLGFSTVEEGVDKALEAGADIVVLCSSDDEYAEYAIPAYKYLDSRAMFVVAGAPACADDLKAAGIENFIHVRVDQLKTLKEYNAKLGI